MTPILFLASDLAPGCASRRLARIASSLDPERFKVEVHAVPVKLRRIAANLKPRIVHAWGPEAVRASFAIASRSDGGYEPRLIVSGCSFVPGSASYWLTRRRMRRCDRVVATTWVEAERYRGLGVPADRLTRIAPGVEAPPPVNRAAIRQSLQLPEKARYIVVGGTLDHDCGVKLALWAFGLVHSPFRDLHLVILGDGPILAKLAEFARATMKGESRVHFAGDRADGAEIIAAADIAWMVRPRGDVSFVLEAMAAGVPTVAWRLPDIAELIDDSATGVLVDVEQPADLAKKTHALLTEDASRTTLAELGRITAAERFPAAREIGHFAALYDELC